MRIPLTIQKFNPEQDPAPYSRTYFVEAPKGMTLLGALLKLKEEVDGTLTFRASCRAAICGSCIMQVNGIQKLACALSLRDEMERHGKITVAPMANMPVIKDLAVRMEPFWDKLRAVTPYVIPGPDAAPSGALRALPETMHNADGCIMCGACLSACTSHEVSPTFLGPAALAKAYRVQVDPRDSTHSSRLSALQEPGGIWDCVRCNFCVQVCPKDVQPMEQIIRLRRMSLSAGFTQTVAARHITQFVKIVSHEGRLNEAQLPFRMTWTSPGALLRILPLGLRMLLHGKIPFPFKPAHRTIQAIFKRRQAVQSAAHIPKGETE